MKTSTGIRNYGGVRTHDALRTSDQARKTRVAVFEGRHHVSERNEKGDLEIFALHDEYGTPATEMGATQDRSAPERLRAMNRSAARFWSRP